MRDAKKLKHKINQLAQMSSSEVNPKLAALKRQRQVLAAKKVTLFDILEARDMRKKMIQEKIMMGTLRNDDF